MTDTPQSGQDGHSTDAPAAMAGDMVHDTPETPFRPRIWPRLVGVAILVVGVGGAWLWQNPGYFRHGASSGDAAVKALEARVARLEQRPATADTAALIARLDALEQRIGQTVVSAPQSARPTPAPAFDPRPLIARLEALEAKELSGPAAAPAGRTGEEAVPPSGLVAPPELRSLLARLDALEHTVADREAAQRPADAVTARLDDMEHQLSGMAAKDANAIATADRALHLARIESAEIALALGRPLGAIPEAPKALARFATAAPPTEAGLRAAFPAAEREAVAVSVPDTEGKPFLGRVLARLQDVNLVTVREGDHVVVGNATADILTHARALLDAGDLAAAVRTVSALTGPPAEKMAAWLADANALLAAREALAVLARDG